MGPEALTALRVYAGVFNCHSVAQSQKEAVRGGDVAIRPLSAAPTRVDGDDEERGDSGREGILLQEPQTTCFKRRCLPLVVL